MDAEIYRTIRKLLAIGFAAVPAAGKRPVVAWRTYQERLPTQAEAEEWARQKHYDEVTGVAVVLDKGTWQRWPYLWVLDIEQEKRAEAEEALRQRRPELLEDGLIAESGGGGLHIWLLASRPVQTGPCPYGDIKGGGSIIIVPPSVHPETGRRYRWLSRKEPLRADPEELGLRSQEERSSRAYLKLASGVGPGERHNAIKSLAGVLRNLGFKGAILQAALLGVNQAACQPPLPEKEVLDIAEWADRLDILPEEKRGPAGLLIGSLLAGSPVEAVRGLVQPEEIEEEEPRRILAAIYALHDRGEPITEAGVALEAGLTAEAVSRYRGLPEGEDSVRARAVYLAQQSRKVRLARALVNIESRLWNGTSPAEAAGELSKLIEEAYPPEARLLDPRKQLELLQETWHKGGLFLPSGISALDAAVEGLVKGGLTVIGGRPGRGKTTLLEQLAQNLTSYGPVLFVSREMTPQQLAARRLGMLAGVAWARAMDQRRATPDELARLQAARLKFENKLIFTLHGKTTTADIERAARSLDGLSAVFVDYIQILDDEGRDEFERVSRIARRLKDLAGRLGVPVIAASQLSRVGELQDRPPGLADMRQSGQIEQEADLVLALHHFSPHGWADMQERHAKLKARGGKGLGSIFEREYHENNAVLYVLKNRHGPLCPPILLYFDPASQQFKEAL
jgi:replicative DNA helicase